jgi:hypothetical protein
MSGGRVLLNIVGVMLGFVAFGAAGCHGDCSCPASPGSAAIQLGCVPIQPPVVTTTGPCSVCPVALPNGMIPPGAGCAVPPHSSYVILNAKGAGTCHVELTFGNGATSSVDVDFISDGEGFLAASADGSPDIQVSVPEPICDAGLWPKRDQLTRTFLARAIEGAVSAGR